MYVLGKYVGLARPSPHQLLPLRTIGRKRGEEGTTVPCDAFAHFLSTLVTPYRLQVLRKYTTVDALKEEEETEGNS